MSVLRVRHMLREIYRKARKVHTELGPGCPRKRYVGALAAQFSGCRYGCERDVTLPFIEAPQDGPADFLKADFTFLRRKVLVRVVLYRSEISEGVCRDLWRRMNATGVPLGIILNFGMPEFEYRRVMHNKHLQQWRAERMHSSRVLYAGPSLA